MTAGRVSHAQGLSLRCNQAPRLSGNVKPSLSGLSPFVIFFICGSGRSRYFSRAGHPFFILHSVMVSVGFDDDIRLCGRGLYPLSQRPLRCGLCATVSSKSPLLVCISDKFKYSAFKLLKPTPKCPVDFLPHLLDCGSRRIDTFAKLRRT